MTPRQIDLVQDSFALVLPIPDDVAAAFYRRLFALAPDTKPLFRNDMGEQGRKLVMTLAAVVDGLDAPDTILPVARELAIRHVRYGVVDRHYDAVGTALLATLADAHGATWSPDLEAAWGVAYQLVSDTMRDAARLAA